MSPASQPAAIIDKSQSRILQPGPVSHGFPQDIFAIGAGWYYLRNAVLLETPFQGTWSAEGGFAWWQDPGYRSAGQYLRIAQALIYPVYTAAAATPCLVVLAIGGIEWLTRNRWLRATVLGLIVSWAVFVYAGFFVI